MQVKRLIEVLEMLPPNSQVVVEKEPDVRHTVTGVVVGYDKSKKTRVILRLHKKPTNK